MTLINRSSDKEEQSLMLQRIGAGSFAVVYSMTGTRKAYKAVRNLDEIETLRREYNALGIIYTTYDSSSFFKIPRPIAFRDFNTALNTAVYTMERVFVLPADFATHIAHEFYPHNSRHEPGPRLCRLYLGKVIEHQSKFFNPSNFPLSPARYQQLQLVAPLAPLNNVAYAMGQMLGHIHWVGGFDARDIEFILGGDGYEGYSYYVIDFNQMRKWGRTLPEISNLVDAHYLNDPYYPRARPNDGLYEEFKNGYLSASASDLQAQTISQAFLHAIEEEQSRRDGQHDI